AIHADFCSVQPIVPTLNIGSSNIMDILPLSIGCGNSDRTRAIRDGRVPIEGCKVNYITLEPEEVFFRAFRNGEFDVTELSFSSYILSLSKGQSPYIAIP